VQKLSFYNNCVISTVIGHLKHQKLFSVSRKTLIANMMTRQTSTRPSLTRQQLQQQQQQQHQMTAVKYMCVWPRNVTHALHSCRDSASLAITQFTLRDFIAPYVGVPYRCFYIFINWTSQRLGKKWHNPGYLYLTYFLILIFSLYLWKGWS